MFTHLAASERNIDQLDVELVRALCLGEHGLLGMLSTGDALNEVHDRSQTAFTQLARLGTTLVTGLMSAADSFTPEALREWVGELLDVVRERVRSECDALVARTKGRLARFECQRRVHPGGCVGALFGKSR